MERLENILKSIGWGILCILGGLLAVIVFIGLLVTPPFGWIILALIIGGNHFNDKKWAEVREIVEEQDATRRKSPFYVPSHVPKEWSKSDPDS